MAHGSTWGSAVSVAGKAATKLQGAILPSYGWTHVSIIINHWLHMWYQHWQWINREFATSGYTLWKLLWLTTVDGYSWLLAINAYQEYLIVNHWSFTSDHWLLPALTSSTTISKHSHWPLAIMNHHKLANQLSLAIIEHHKPSSTIKSQPSSPSTIIKHH